MEDKPAIISELEKSCAVTLTRLPEATQWATPLSYAVNEKGQVITLNFSGAGLKELVITYALQHLQKLDVSHNELINIRFNADLPELELLDISYNTAALQPIHFSHSFAKLKYLYIYNSGLTGVRFTKGLRSLDTLNLANNELTNIDLPGRFDNLVTLHLQKNAIEEITAEGGLPGLQYVDISKNNLSDIQFLLQASLLDRVLLNENTALEESIPAEVLAADWNAIKKHLLGENANTNVLFPHVKILLLGNPNVGKSWLLHYLDKGGFPENNEPTHGIQYRKISISESEVSLHCWDFGGQEYFHATHKLFFSPGALNIVLWSREDVQRDESKEEKCFEKKYWLRCIEQLSMDKGETRKRERKDKVLLAENKIDMHGGLPSAIDQPVLEADFECLRFYYSSFSLKEKKRLLGLKEIIAELSEELIGRRIKEYKDYLDTIAALQTPVVNITEITNKKVSEEDIRSAMLVFRNMGMLLYFDDIMPDKVFIQPQALLDLLYGKVLGKKESATITSGDIASAVESDPLNLTAAEVISLLQRFDLIFQIKEAMDTFFIPQYLGAAPAMLTFFRQYQFQRANIKVESDSFLMSVAMLKLFGAYGRYVKTGESQQGYLFWKDGLIIEKDKQLLMVEFDRAEQVIVLYPDLQHQNFALQKEVVDFILSIGVESGRHPVQEVKKAQIMDEEPGVIISEGVDMPPGGDTNKDIQWQSDLFTIWVSLDGQYFARWTDLLGSRARQLYRVEALWKISKPGSNPEMKTTMLSVFKFNDYLPDNKKGNMKKIFISYSKDDLAQVNTFIDHLAALQIDGKVSHWYCTELIAGTVWNTEIQERFDEADIICFMISPNFMKTKYIREHEIAKAFQRKNTDKDFSIVPIILEYCSWQTTENNLAGFTALPYMGRPVSAFSNPHKAWYLIQEFLRMLIDEDAFDTGTKFYTDTSRFSRDIREILVECAKNIY